MFFWLAMSLSLATCCSVYQKRGLIKFLYFATQYPLLLELIYCTYCPRNFLIDETLNNRELQLCGGKLYSLMGILHSIFSFTR
ncbi:hypothetical protein BD410DRAFT_161641 [Rickenella mellea]|uniref:Secreted protein n=1 Tax=Rickenella mellea TaxID=50990 RepID=A0A4Y7Q9D4_9AGAM|nr:hypothetical protein BD410DRAFT_161641 [Rickenella mellea]